MSDPVLIIPTLGARHLRQCIESIDIDVRLLVIANGDVDDDLLAYGGELWLIDLPHNIGYPAAVNLGIKCYPAEPYWLIANDDVILAPGDLQRLVDAEGFGWTGINDWSVCKLTAETIETVGWLDEDFHPAYCEDADYERRCDLAGIPRGFIQGDTTHAGSACLRVHRADNARTYPRNVQHYHDKWGTGVRQGGGFATPFALPERPPSPRLSRLREGAWTPDR